MRRFLSSLLLRLYVCLKPLVVRNKALVSVLRLILVKSPWIMKLLHYDQSLYYEGLRSSRKCNAIFVDVSHYSKTRLKTGIQRVVLSLYKELREMELEGYRLQPVVLLNDNGRWHYRYYSLEQDLVSEEIVVPIKGDVFFAVDLNSEISAPVNANLFQDWISRGAVIICTVFDILPISNPEWWPGGVGRLHENWLKSILSISHVVLSISQSTQNEVLKWCKENKFKVDDVRFEWFHLGSDIKPSAEINREEVVLSLWPDIEIIKKKKSFLMVGTIEPRKGHAQCIDAFDQLWAEGHDFCLVIVGAKGWLVDELVSRIKHHSEYGCRLIWLEGADDDVLANCYRSCECLIQASHGEGFGLPIIESARYKLPVLARDIPVFRELADGYATFFDGEDGNSLAKSVKEFVCEKSANQNIDGMPHNDWSGSAEQVAKLMRPFLIAASERNDDKIKIA